MRNRRKSAKNCDHSEAVVSVTAGIQRTVCLGCSAVSIQYDHSVCTTWPDSVTRVAFSEEPFLVGAERR